MEPHENLQGVPVPAPAPSPGLLAGSEPLLLDLLQYGFPRGLQQDHSSSYTSFQHTDRFVRKELEEGGVTGPFQAAPSPATPDYDFHSVDQFEELVVTARPAPLLWKRDLASFVWRGQLYFFTGLMVHMCMCLNNSTLFIQEALSK